MNIYLKWAPYHLSDENNLSIFDLEISQKENHFAKARLVINTIDSLPPTGTEAVIQGEDEEVFFKGFLVGIPINFVGDVAEIELIAKPIDFSGKIEILQKGCRVPPYWDDLWVQPDKHTDFQEIQDVRTSSLYCDRRTGELSQSDWFEGRQTLPLHQNFFSDSLQIKSVGAPLNACTVKVHAHWIQSESGISNLSSHIRRAFPHFKVSTYTKNAILEKWPEPRKRLGRSGIWVVKSELKPVVPPSPFYPKYSPPVPLKEEEIRLKSYRIKRHWFKPILWVGWQVQQKRRETLSFTLFHAFQPIFPGEANHKTLEFVLQNINPDPNIYTWQPESVYDAGTKISYKGRIYKAKVAHTSRLLFEEDQEFWTFKRFFHTSLGDSARSSFFLTDRGYLAAEHAMERAKVVLADSARCVEVSFEGPWEILKKVTTDMSVSLSDPRLPETEIRGKVVKYALIAKGETGERFVRVTLLCAVGSGKVDKIDLKSMPTYVFDGYCDDAYQIHENKVGQTASGLLYYKYDDKFPPDRFKEGHLLRGVEVINGPEEQEAEMFQNAYKSPSALQKALSQNPTRLRLYFKDLRTKDRIDHLISVTMAASWSAPKQWKLQVLR